EPANAFAGAETGRLVLIACSSDLHDFEPEMAVDRPDARHDEFGLGDRELAAACADAEGAHATGAAMRMASCAARTVSSRSASRWAAETNQVSNCDGGSMTPRSSIAPWKRPNMAVSDSRAST